MPHSGIPPLGSVRCCPRGISAERCARSDAPSIRPVVLLKLAAAPRGLNEYASDRYPTSHYLTTEQSHSEMPTADDFTQFLPPIKPLPKTKPLLRKVCKPRCASFGQFHATARKSL